MNILREKRFILVCLMVGMILLSGACSSIPWVSEASEPTPVPVVTQPSSVSAEGKLVPLQYDAISFKSGGVLGEVFVSEGDLVDQGDILAQLGELERLEAALSQARLELLAAQQELDKLHDTATLSREQAGQALVEARTAFKEAKHILPTWIQTISGNSLTSERSTCTKPKKNSMRQKRNWTNIWISTPTMPLELRRRQPTTMRGVRMKTRCMNGTDYRTSLIKPAQMWIWLPLVWNMLNLSSISNKMGSTQTGWHWQKRDVEFAEAQLAAAQRALDNANLIAPYQGTIAQLMDVHVGQNLMAGQPVLTLADFSGWMVETRDLTELDVVKLKPGQQVRVKPDALPELELTGTVESIDQIFTERIGDVLYTVHIRLNETDPRLRWGMTVNAVFED
jgi:multidrug efflux pump subunit AcrA (membrane-fusion protein)